MRPDRSPARDAPSPSPAFVVGLWLLVVLTVALTAWILVGGGAFASGGNDGASQNVDRDGLDGDWTGMDTDLPADDESSGDGSASETRADGDERSASADDGPPDRPGPPEHAGSDGSGSGSGPPSDRGPDGAPPGQDDG